ncbi:EAL domain-containing protein [Virgibacillus pantothenticus]|uniref:Diguanylate phosphodiesterase n=1 Tax=Virgibacillus pantothenticus TaxID=1473 RepID=A0A0L0QL21_VIRPA|nr:EAL-associated domain-containing protein [Virgibacillus pantothenticus]KNE19325.1 diguanylate phosphodiesterase [Virgibacillus pantothenticus]MBU8567635.1 EAL domain-containing protein [Virgibacillus pantothenticus]MBU8602336.1 EAL domain-containing protein [Virgibacillus pantothenticus]MBU8635662.1 EAL domain-containing protein [Virgibacillus pantothenticus]MBU8644286.1 EAL domain-containing protein [Virgibacillus pantothenticus]
MDPLDIMMRLDQIVPYFDPIISAENQFIIGYETIPYFQDDENELHNLLWFFKDSSIPSEFRLELTHNVLQKVLDAYMTTDQSQLLFIHYDAKLLLKDNGDSMISILETYENQGLSLNRLVLQFSEAFVSEHIASLKHLFAYIQTFGIQIAIDDVGEKNGNLDKLALIKPNIIKVDVSFLQEDDLPQLYQDVHHLLSMLSRKIGAALLFKGIASFHQLNYAWRNGGRYYQGEYLEKTQSEFIPMDSCKEKVKKDFQHFITFERKKMWAQLDLTEKINEQLKNTLKTVKSDDPYDKTILSVANNCDDYSFRVYICNEAGFQLSSNAEKDADGTWRLLPEGRQKNWSWRPYFFENIARMNMEKKGILSDLYTDIERDERIRTYSYPISSDRFIFIDIPYDFLFEQEGLL